MEARLSGLRFKREQAEARKSSCDVCYFDGEDSADLDVHRTTLRHIYNITLKEFKEKKSGKSKDKEGIQIDISCGTRTVKYDKVNGKAKSIVPFDPNVTEELKYNFLVINKTDKQLILKNVELLHPLNNFHLVYKQNAKGIMKGGSRKVVVEFTSPGIGYYEVPVCFSFERGNKKLCIIKDMVIDVTTDEFVEEEEKSKSPFTREGWGAMKGVVPAIDKEGYQVQQLTDYPIPKALIPLFTNKLEVWEEITDEQLQLLSNILQSFPKNSGYGQEFEEVHNMFFHLMLHLDEYAARRNLQNYNMADVPMKLITRDRVELKVPGLAEKRPSLLKNDIVRVRVRTDAETSGKVAYEGVITEVRDSVIWIGGLDQSFLNRIEHAGELQVDVRFTLNRYTLICQHYALDYVFENNMTDVIFPKPRTPMAPLISEYEYALLNREILRNNEQRSAIDNIIKGTSRPAPYILFGPPGTGKTVTIVEAILQIKRLFPLSYTLVCAPSNAACDHIAMQLMAKSSTNDLLRMHSRSRDWDTIPKELHQYSNVKDKKIFSLNSNQIEDYHIVVCTLSMAARFAKTFTEREVPHFTHVFVDEAGQAVEPEALVAVGGILGKATQDKIGGQLVLAGDPKQLGPICMSHLAEKAGLGLSLLERLMTHCSLYQRDEEGNFNKRYITKLLDNFRSHPTLLKLPNQLFYDGELKPACGLEIFNDPLCTAPLTSNAKPGQTCVFHGVVGQERREGRSPSYFNQVELDQVMSYVSRLLSPSFPVPVAQSDIGIIAPYIRQVYKLKELLKRKKWEDVEVGSTEIFQGREKRVILISTVRSNRNLLEYDKVHQLGFLVNEKRFNVAITRARALLIVIGCPHVLSMDDNWKELIEHTKRLESYEGCDVPLWTENWVKEVTRRVKEPMKVEE